MAPLIAIVGSDGSGKSTLGAALIGWLRQSREAELCHLGKQSGNLGRSLARLPLLGRRLGRGIDRQVDRTAARGPHALAALAIYGFSLRRLRRFRRMLRLQRRGIAIIADRFPQLSLPAAADGPGFGKVPSDRGLARWLGAAERRQFEWMTRHRPDLVLRLNVDLATALARKPDHRADTLAEKIRHLPALSFGDAPIVDIDATLPAEAVLAAAKAAIAPILAAQAADAAARAARA